MSIWLWTISECLLKENRVPLFDMGSCTKYQVITDHYNMVLIMMVAMILIPDQPQALGNLVISLGYTQAACVHQTPISM